MRTHRALRVALCLLPVVLWPRTAGAQGAPETSAPHAAQVDPAGEADVDERVAPPASDERGFVLRSADGVNSLRILGLLQLQYASAWDEGARVSDTLFVNRARVGLMGSVFSRNLRYLLVAELAGTSARLLFLTLDYTLVPDWLTVRVGQFKRPFSRSFITMASQLSMVDRPLTVGPAVFGDGVDVGVMLHNGTEGNLEYAVGVFRGGAPGATPERVAPLVAVRVGYNLGRVDGYSESDLTGGPLRLGVAAAGLLGFTGAGAQDTFRSGLVDLTLKAHGFSAALSLYAGDRDAEPDAPTQHVRGFGHSLQLGYVIAGRVEPVLRYAFLAHPGAADAQHDLAGGLNLYLHGHALKLQTFVSARLREGQGTPTWLLQAQLSAAL